MGLDQMKQLLNSEAFEPSTKWKSNLPNGRRYLQMIYISDKRLTSKIYQEPINLNFFFFKCFIYFWERERERDTECKLGRDRERGRQRIRSSLQTLNCQHRAWHGAQTHEPWDHDLSRKWMLNRLTHPGTPSV